MKNQKKLQEQNQDRSLPKLFQGNLLATYINVVIQSLLGLIIAIGLGTLIRYIWKSIPAGIYISIIFVVLIFFSILTQKYFHKLAIGQKLQEKYVNFLIKYTLYGNVGEKT